MFNKVRFFWLSLFRDRGHRLYGVAPEAHEPVLKGIELIGGPKKLVTLDLGSSQQTILTDGFTVIHALANSHPMTTPPIPTGTAISFRVKDPTKSAARLVEFLRHHGFSANAEDKGTLTSMPPNLLVVVTSNAFQGWEIALTVPARRLPLPPLK